MSLDSVRFRAQSGESWSLWVPSLTGDEEASYEYQTNTIKLGKERHTKNLHLLLTTKGNLRVSGDGKTLKKVSGIGGRLKYWLNEKEEKEKVKQRVKKTLKIFNKKIKQLEKSGEWSDDQKSLYRAASRVCFERMFQKKILLPKHIREGSTLDKFISPEIKSEKEQLEEAMKEVRDGRNKLPAIMKMEEHLVKTAYKEADSFEGMGILMQAPDKEGSGGTRRTHSRYQDREDNAHATLVLKRDDAGADGKNNKTLRSLVKKLFRTAPASMKGNSGARAEYLAYRADRHLRGWFVPSTYAMNIKSATYEGDAQAFGSMQGFVEKSTVLAKKIEAEGIPTKYDGLPRSILAKHYQKHEREIDEIVEREPFQRVGMFDWAIEGGDTHDKNVMLKEHVSDHDSLPARLLAGEYVLDSEIHNFVKNLFKVPKPSPDAENVEPISNYQLMLRALLSQQVKRGEDRKHLYIKIDNEKSFPHSHPNSHLLHGYLHTRYKGHAFDVFPSGASKPENGTLSEMRQKEGAFIAFLEEMAHILLLDQIPQEKLDGFLSEKKNRKLLNNWMKISPKGRIYEETQIIPNGEEFYRNQILDKLCPEGTPRKVRNKYSRELKRIHGMAYTRRESWILLLDHLEKKDRPMRELYRIRKQQDFTAKMKEDRGLAAYHFSQAFEDHKFFER